MPPKTKTLLWLMLLSLVDLFIPLPITALILIYVVFDRPAWFTDLVQKIYSDK